MKTLLFYLGFALFFVSTYLQAQPTTQWQQGFGGTGGDEVFSTSATRDGGYVMLGRSNSTNGSVTGNHGGTDYWLVKTNATGILQWEKSYGGTGDDRGYSVTQTSDGGYIMVGMSASNNGDVTGNHGGGSLPYDVWVVKTDSLGTIQWQKCYGGTGQDYGTCILETSSGNYVVYGVTLSSDGDVVGNHGTSDEWVFKLDATGNLLWQRCYGGTMNEGTNAYDFGRKSLVSTNDGGYFITGCSSSNDGDVTGHHTGPGTLPAGDFDAWAIKIDSMGAIQWQQSYGGTGFDRGRSGFQTADGGYIFSAQSTSTDDDVTGHIQVAGAVQPTENTWVVKLDAAGNIQWQKIVSFGLGDYIAPTNDGGYIVGIKQFLIKLDAFGNIQWEELSYGAGDVSTVFQLSDGGYIVGLYGAVSLYYGDFLIQKLSPVPTNVITGYVFEDLNSNCVKDTNEVGLPGRIVRAVPGNYYATTDAQGNYTLFVDTGFYTVNHTPSIYYNQSCVTSYTANINSVTPNSYNNNFADTLRMHCADLILSVGAPGFRQCFKNTLSVYYANTGSVAAYNVSITLSFDSYIIPLSSSIPYTIVGGNYVFTIDTILPGQTGNFSVLDSVSCALVVGLHNSCVLGSIQTTTTAECNVANNNACDCHYLVGSCDPNAKEVAISTTGYTTQENCTATDTLTYMIRFQNTGTFAASTVVVRDTLPTYVDVTSVESGAASAVYSFRTYGQGILEWTFNNINLPDSTTNEVASHGFVKFTVRQKPNNAQGTVIKNSANIIFDYNNAVLTDTTVITIPQQTTGVESNYINNKNVIVYPNPTNNMVVVKSQTELGLVTIYNVVGAVIYTQKVNANEQQIDLSKQASGIYFLQTQNTYLKIIKE
jgi:uncharacterized repeat protein (TIGR01451 family)